MNAGQGCDVCTGIETVTYDGASASKPLPFCSRCGRIMATRYVYSSPAEPQFQNRPRAAAIEGAP